MLVQDCTRGLFRSYLAESNKKFHPFLGLCHFFQQNKILILKISGI